MKIVEAISDTNVGGAGILLLTRLKYSDRNRFDSTVLLPRGSALAERFRAIGITVCEVDVRGDRSFSFRAIGAYRKALHRIRPDLVNAHGNLSCRIAAWLCRVPIRLYTRHCAYEPKRWQKVFPGKQLLGAVQALLSPHIIAVAEAARKNLTDTGMDPRRICVIINGVEGVVRQSERERVLFRQQLGIPQDAVVVGICARLEPCKDHATFLRAAERLLKRSSFYHFLIIGGGSLADDLKEICEERGISAHVTFTGFVFDVTPYWNIVDINVNCSKGTETSSLALSEGMSLGIPAVVSDYGGNPYMVRQGENGLVYPVGRDDLLAENIRRLAEDDVLYTCLSEGAYRRFQEELNAEQMTKKTEQLYEKLFRSVRCQARGSRCRNRSEARRHRRSL